jgi:hypothetical protein
LPGATVTLGGRASAVGAVSLEQRGAGADWQPGPALTLGEDGTFTVAVVPTETTEYRLAAGTVRSAILRVVVAQT